jgi:hypothetical protein
MKCRVLRTKEAQALKGRSTSSAARRTNIYFDFITRVFTPGYGYVVLSGLSPLPIPAFAEMIKGDAGMTIWLTNPLNASFISVLHLQ